MSFSIALTDSAFADCRKALKRVLISLEGFMRHLDRSLYQVVVATDSPQDESVPCADPWPVHSAAAFRAWVDAPQGRGYSDYRFINSPYRKRKVSQQAHRVGNTGLQAGANARNGTSRLNGFAQVTHETPAKSRC
jgi:hypothetical protein